MVAIMREIDRALTMAPGKAFVAVQVGGAYQTKSATDPLHLNMREVAVPTSHSDQPLVRNSA